MTTVQKNDFVELEFTATVKGGEIFDTNVLEDAKKAGLNEKAVAPMILAIGKAMTLKGLDKELEGKEIGKKYSVELNPEDAFGKRDSKMVRMIPLKIFIEQRIMPERGMQLSLDGMLVKVLSVNSGRVLVDFNNPLSGKVVVYNYIIKRKVEDKKEQVNAVQDFFLRNKFDFDLTDKEVVFKVDDNTAKFLKIFENQFEDILGLKIATKAPEIPKQEKKKEETKAENKK